MMKWKEGDTGGLSTNSREKGAKRQRRRKAPRLERLEPICATADSVRGVA